MAMGGPQPELAPSSRLEGNDGGGVTLRLAEGPLSTRPCLPFRLPSVVIPTSPA